MTENTVKKQRSKKIVKMDQQETAITKPLAGEDKRLFNEFIERLTRSSSLPRSKNMEYGVDHHEGHRSKGIAYAALMEICQTDHVNVAMRIVNDAASVHTSDNHDDCLNRALEQIASLAPQDYLESMLVSQMVQVNNAVAKCMQMAFLKDQTTYGKELNANLAIKLQRTFVAQIEALKKYRSTGQQKVTVEHVTVNEGGQAIVGHVDQGGGGNK